jgi:hypothetical protein
MNPLAMAITQSWLKRHGLISWLGGQFAVLLQGTQIEAHPQGFLSLSELLWENNPVRRTHRRKGNPMKKSLITLGLALFASVASVASAQSQRSGKSGVGLNIYCEPIETVYAGGSPLFNERTGEFTELEEYLARKQLNIYCDPADMMYAGGSPLFNEATGESISLQDYLAKKRWARGVNQYCDPIGTMYMGGTPLFDERTGERISKVDYLTNKGLNVYCDALGTVYAGGTPLFDPATGRTQSLSAYLAKKFVIVR